MRWVNQLFLMVPLWSMILGIAATLYITYLVDNVETAFLLVITG
jgi:hypothetical protein